MGAARNLFIAVCLMASSSSIAAVSQLTEHAVRQLLAKVDKAITTQDVKLLGESLSDNVEITLVISAGGQTQRATMNKAQYLEAARTTWASASNYTYRRSNERIAIAGSTATVQAEVLESMVMGSQLIRSVTQETATVELVNGVAVATKVVGYSTLQ
ncbi:MAG: hypothetical protein K0R03_2287 [Moraxellaceae bacterium]|jgi:hypothetical protein|nr:hypothetical protein [Moraxellaceae bacterium]